MNDNEKPKRTRAPGGGRKPADPAGAKITGSYRLPPDVVALIRAAPSQSAYLEAAVRYYHARPTES